MNKKQKVLTIVTLTVFAAIIGLHYVGFEPPGWRTMTAQEFLEWKASQPAPKAKAATTDPNRGDIFDQVVAQARKGKYDDLIAAAKAKAATKFDPSTAMPAPSPPEVEHGWYLKTEAGWALIEDVRMPLFVLVVFYTGLFFLLQDKRARVV